MHIAENAAPVTLRGRSRSASVAEHVAVVDHLAGLIEGRSA